MLQFKPEVRIGYLSPMIHHVLDLAAVWSYRTGVGVEVNSIDDGANVHMANSLHGYGLAIDIDTVGDKTTDLEQLFGWFRRHLDPQYDVVYEGNHVHVEWDTRRPALKKLT